LGGSIGPASVLDTTVAKAVKAGHGTYLEYLVTAIPNATRTTIGFGTDSSTQGAQFARIGGQLCLFLGGGGGNCIIKPLADSSLAQD